MQLRVERLCGASGGDQAVSMPSMEVRAIACALVETPKAPRTLPRCALPVDFEIERIWPISHVLLSVEVRSRTSVSRGNRTERTIGRVSSLNSFGITSTR